MLSNLRFACRSLMKSPGFAATSIAALALGVGANTAIFSLVNQLLLNPPGIVDPGRVLAVRAKYDKLNLKNIPLSVPDFADVREGTQVFSYTGLMRGGDFNYTGGELPERLQGANVSQQWFEVFGARPIVGRTFLPEEDLPNGNPVVVLAYATWKRLFGGSETALNRVIELNQKPYRIIGVMGPEFRYPRQTDVWAPLALAPDLFNEQNRFNESYFTVARLRPGVSQAQGESYVQTVAGRLRNSATQTGGFARNGLWGMFTIPMTDFVAGETRKPMLVLLGAVGFVLLIACSNIAGLMVARTSGRAREIAVRAALGAGRRQLVSQLLAESLLLAAGGAIFGLAVAYAGIRLLLALAPENSIIGLDARIDMYALAFTAAVSIVSGVLFGLAPGWQIARIDPYEILKSSGRSASAGYGRQRLRAALVVGEAALAVVLLVGAGLFLRSLSRLQEVKPGFDPRGIMTARLSLPITQYKEPQQRIVFYRSALERLRAAPGVDAAAASSPIPFSGDGNSASFAIQGRTTSPTDPGPHGDLRWATPGFFEAMGIPLKLGRAFGAQDAVSSEPAVVIDENLARQYWPGENPLGQHIRNGNRPWATIVGMVGHVYASDLASDTGKGVYYYCLLQQPLPFASLVVKTHGDPVVLAGAIRAAVREVDPNQPVHTVKTMQDLVTATLAPRKFVVRLLGFFAMVALLMAALGLYGVISYSVTQRTQEMGIRMALGAQSGSLLALVVGQGLRLAGIGVAVGLAMAFALSRLLQNQFFGVSALDPVTLLSISAALLGATFLASYVPARRATRVDPLEALRCE